MSRREPEKKTKALFGQSQRDAVKVAITDTKERWSETTLADGSVLRLKAVVLRVYRAVDSYDNEGNPMYSIKMHHVVDVETPDQLKKGASGSSTEEVH